VTQAPILFHTLSCQDLSQNVAILECEGPFKQTFITDSAAVCNILQLVWGKSSWWTHCKPYKKTKNGRQAFRTLHAQLLGGPRVVATGDTIVNRIQTLVYEGHRRHFTFNKYVQLQVDQHNLQNDLTDYGVAPLAESMKVLWFQKGIRDKSMEPIKASIVAQTSNPETSAYTTFQAVQEAYMAFYRQQTGNEPPRACQVSSVRGGQQNSTARRSGRGRGPTKTRSQGVYSKAELNACVAEDRKYSADEYKRLTPLQQQKLWILRNPGKTPGQGPTRQEKDKASVASTSTSTGKRSHEDDTDNHGDAPSSDNDRNPGWGWNRSNPAIKGWQKKTDDMDI
jgi:hypothetical protein